MTPGQGLAVEQLRRIAAQGAGLEIVRIFEPDGEHSSLRVEVSVYCGDMARVPAGLPLRDRERMILSIGENFPYEAPSVSVTHRRFARYPHVNWSRLLCLYQAPQTEWLPSTGMFGLVGRLELWLRQAAIDQLDPTGGAMHPPVTYHTAGPLFIARCDAPVTDGHLWMGLAELRAVSDRRVDLVGWKTIGEPSDGGLVGAAILLDRPMPLEFPDNLGELLGYLEERGVSLEQVFDTVRAALLRNGKDQPLYVVIGTPMRGMRGGTLRQHLNAWSVDSLTSDIIDLEGGIGSLQREIEERAGTQSPELATLRARVLDLFRRWTASANVTWCRMSEHRPEVTVRRDVGRPAAAFAGKVVEVWGCGALGGYIAESLLRSGVVGLVLRDSSVVTPGILVRQPFADADIGRPKAEVLAERLLAIGLCQNIRAVVGDVLDAPLGESRLANGADIVIDATASNIVLTKVEEVWTRTWRARCRIASVAIDRNAERLLAVLARPGHAGGPLDLVRRLKLSACQDSRCAAHLDAFFPENPAPPFQPEPGCSDATFIGSAADAALLAAAAVNFIGDALQSVSAATGSGCFFAASSASKPGAGRIGFDFSSDLVLYDPQTEYETRIDPLAWRCMERWKEESRRTRGVDVETGGLLFGEMDEHLRIVWVSEASGPPRDSKHSAKEFISGIEGTTALNAEKTKRTRRSVQYVGTWHTHPVCEADPSVRDLSAMAVLLTQSPIPVERLLLLIIGRDNNRTEAMAGIFLRQEFEELQRKGFMSRRVARRPIDCPMPREVKVGIALSGGGSRAMAFHLGCLRALQDAGILSKAEVLSTVSGGSVIGAMYAYSDDSFADFEGRVRAVLRRGLVGGLARRTLLSLLTPQIIATQAIAGVAAKAAFAARFVLGQLERIWRRDSKARGLTAQSFQPPLRRWASRTEAFEQTLRDRFFGTQTVGSPRRHDLDIVLNACELRTGTAFRMGSRESGSWRYGVVEENNLEVATAVAASAAYPALLPAIDRYFSFKRQGETTRERVILTDGGVYENLGVSCMTPDKDATYSTNVFHPSVIICCDAGPGQFSDGALPYGWMTRMRRSFEATHRQVQHGLQQQLHLWMQLGAIDAFIYSYLGQQDERLPVVPPELVRREEVVHYPTDFSAMSDQDIDLLSRRGEQLTRLLLQHYCPDL